MASVQLALKGIGAVGFNPGPSGPAMVEPEAGADGHGAAHEGPGLMAEREQEFHGPDEIGITAKQPFAFAQGFSHQPDFAVFQIAQSAMDNTGGTTGGAGGKIILLRHGNFFAVASAFPRYGDAVDTSADDQDIKALTVKGQSSWAGQLHSVLDAGLST